MLALILIILLVYTLIARKTILRNKSQCTYYREIPTNDTPAYVGKIVKGNIDGNDIISTILDLNYRGYISIKIENIRGKNKKILYLQKKANTLDLQEHETFLINQIFKNRNSIIFDDYLKSSKFKNDFKAVNKMLDRRIERKSIYKNSLLKNINKIIFLVSFLLLGTILFYSIVLPITLSTLNLFSIEKTIILMSTIGISLIIFLIIAYKYINYINKSTSAQENINLSITYILLTIVFGISIIIGDFTKLKMTIYDEIIWYKVAINFVLSIITLLYMFNIIKHDEKREYWYYFLAIVSMFSIILNFKITICIMIIFFTTYIFFKSPKHTNLRDDYTYKWESFKKYLEDYSMLSNQEENAILIWEKYLIYAISLGINKKIIKHYRNLSNTILVDEQYLKRFYIEYLD
ncbi:MAG: DUF2207 domain-containing protein [Clostridia bacterium]|nr:DUF2207 domain-containing protein [Clostridia bacterium]